MKRILVWDAPNMDMCLSEFYDRVPIASERPSMKDLMQWFVGRGKDDTILACVFINVNVNQPANPRFHSWLRFLSTQGYYVFAKPKAADGSGDIDDDMLGYIKDHLDDELGEVVIGSHDAKCFEAIVPELYARGVNVLVLGYSELSNGWENLTPEQFMDLEAIPGLFASPVPRHINIWNLPPEGTLFEPSGKAQLRSSERTRAPKRVNPRKSAATLSAQPEAPA